MTLTEMVLAVAENLNMLADDQTTINEGTITQAGIKSHINRTYREKLFSVLVDKFPEDFEQTTVNSPMYSESGVVDAATTSTSLVATSGIFSSSDVGMYVYNVDLGEKTLITGYVSSTNVTVADDVSAWDNDSILILQDTYTFGGETADLREVLGVYVTYDGTNWVQAKRILRNNVDYNSIASKYNPRYSLTSVSVAGVKTNAIKIFPVADNAVSEYYIVYTEKPPVMSDSDEPVMKNVGISDALIAEATAWGWILMRDPNIAGYWSKEYDKQLTVAVRTYKPLHRNDAPQSTMSSYFEAIRNRDL